MNSEDEFKNNSTNKVWLLDERSFKKKSWIIIFLICIITIVIHGVFILIFYLGLNNNLLLKSVPSAKKTELIYELAYKEPDYNKDQQINYVATNSNLLPEIPPENTNNFGAQSQQAAQETLADKLKKDDLPTIQGDDEIFSQIAKGYNEQQEGISGEPDLTPVKDSLIAIEEKEEKEVGLKTRPKPKPRPRIKKLLDGPLNKHEGNIAKMGPVAMDARFSQFGAYLEKMFEAIIYQNRILFSDYSPTAADWNSEIILSYSLDEEGNVNNLIVEFATASNLAVILCKDAILSQAPFGPWTEEMKMVLGKEQTIKYALNIKCRP